MLDLVIFEQLFSPPTQAQTTLLYDTNYTTLWDRTALYTTLQFASHNIGQRHATE